MNQQHCIAASRKSAGDLLPRPWDRIQFAKSRFGLRQGARPGRRPADRNDSEPCRKKRRPYWVEGTPSVSSGESPDGTGGSPVLQAFPPAHPEGMFENSPAFQRRDVGAEHGVPEGRLKGPVQLSLRDFDLTINPNPALKRRAIFVCSSGITISKLVAQASGPCYSNQFHNRLLERVLKLGGPGDSPGLVGDPPTGTRVRPPTKGPCSLGRMHCFHSVRRVAGRHRRVACATRRFSKQALGPEKMRRSYETPLQDARH